MPSIVDGHELNTAPKTMTRFIMTKQRDTGEFGSRAQQSPVIIQHQTL
jgi:hypothetical protein